MKFLWRAKDGGPESKVWAWGLEIKSLFSILVLKFEQGSREAYHSHAFNAISWVLSGWLREDFHTPQPTEDKDVMLRGWFYYPSVWPVFTGRGTFHKVTGIAPATWVLSFRGPWLAWWCEFANNRHVTLTHGRIEA